MPARPPLPPLAFAFALSVALPAVAAEVTVTEAWVRGTVAGQRATGAFMTLTARADMALVGASSPVAKVVEVHEMALDGGVMKMRAVSRIDLPAGKPVALKPGGYHVMLMALQAPVAEGTKVPIALEFEARGGQRTIVTIEAPVRALTAR